MSARNAKAREAILGSIRANLELARAELVPTEVATSPCPGRPAGLDDRDTAIAHLSSTLESVAGRVTRVATRAALAPEIARIFDAHGVTTIAASNAAWIPAVRASLGERFRWLATDCTRDELFAADAGLTGAQLGIAETGTLVLVSEDERHRLASLVPPVHVAVLPVARIVATLGDALAALRGSLDSGPDPTLTWITGPSRTADIELTLVVGVHGPRALHVVLLEEEEA